MRHPINLRIHQGINQILLLFFLETHKKTGCCTENMITPTDTKKISLLKEGVSKNLNGGNILNCLVLFSVNLLSNMFHLNSCHTLNYAKLSIFC